MRLRGTAREAVFLKISGRVRQMRIVTAAKCRISPLFSHLEIIALFVSTDIEGYRMMTRFPRLSSLLPVCRYGTASSSVG